MCSVVVVPGFAKLNVVFSVLISVCLMHFPCFVHVMFWKYRSSDFLEDHL